MYIYVIISAEMGGLYRSCKPLVKWFCISSIDYAGDLRHGEEHRVVAQGYPGQGEPDEGGSDPSGREDQAYQRGAL